MLIDLRMARVNQILDSAAQGYAYVCQGCGAEQHMERTRCVLCGDRRYRISAITHRDLPLEVVASALSIPPGKSFSRIRHTSVLVLAQADPQKIEHALQKVVEHFREGSVGFLNNPNRSIKLATRAERLLQSLVIKG